MPSTHLALLVVAGIVSGVVNAVAGGGSLLLFPALLAVESEGITGCIAGRAIYEGRLDFAAAVTLAAGEA